MVIVWILLFATDREALTLLIQNTVPFYFQICTPPIPTVLLLVLLSILYYTYIAVQSIIPKLMKLGWGFTGVSRWLGGRPA